MPSSIKSALRLKSLQSCLAIERHVVARGCSSVSSIATCVLTRFGHGLVCLEQSSHPSWGRREALAKSDVLTGKHVSGLHSAHWPEWDAASAFGLYLYIHLKCHAEIFPSAQEAAAKVFVPHLHLPLRCSSPPTFHVFSFSLSCFFHSAVRFF